MAGMGRRDFETLLVIRFTESAREPLLLEILTPPTLPFHRPSQQKDQHRRLCTRHNPVYLKFPKK